MLTIKVLLTAWNIGWFFIDPQIGYLLLPLTIISYGAPHKKVAK
jgi:hypothetical protein